MSDAVCEKNLARYQVGRFLEDDTPFCLLQVRSYEPENPDMEEKIEDLLAGRMNELGRSRIEVACNLGGCTLKLIESASDGRKMVGACKAADYCLKKEFALVGEGKLEYREIFKNLEGHSSKHSAGNFCPRLACGLSAGVSIDMVPGTAGECLAETTPDSPQLFPQE